MITKAEDSYDDIPPDDEDLFKELEDGEGTLYTMQELLDEVTKLGDCIITVPTENVQELKEGLTRVKARWQGKLIKSGITPDNNVLSYLVYDAKEKGQSCVRIKLAPRKAVRVFSIETPSEEF